MKSIKPHLAKSFSIEDIIDKFEAIANDDKFAKWLFVDKEVTNTKWVEDEEGEMQRVESPETLSVLRAQNGYTYGWRNWLLRLFTKDIALKRGMAREGDLPKVYLHDKFKWCFENPRGGEFYDSKAGMLTLEHTSVVKYWLGAQFGFFNWNDTVVQINPAWLFLIPFVPENKRQIVYSMACAESRIIVDIDEQRSEYALNRFEYYLNALCGNRNSRGLELRAFNFGDIRDHWLVKDLHRTRYLTNKGITKDELLYLLPKLGNVIHFGWCPQTSQLEAMIPNEFSDIEDLNRAIREGELGEQMWDATKKLMVFTNGGYMTISTYDTDFLSSDKGLSKQLTGCLEYFSKYAKGIVNGEDYRSLSQIKDDMKMFGFFEEATVKKKDFIKTYLIPKLEVHGFKVEPTSSIINERKSRTLYVKAPKLGREGAKK